MRHHAIPDWIISITDQEAAMYRASHHAARLLSPVLEWDSRSEELFGAKVGLHVYPFMPACGGSRWDVYIVYRNPPLLTLRLWWTHIDGPIRRLPERETEWHMKKMYMCIIPSLPQDPMIYVGRIGTRKFIRVAQGIATILTDGYTHDRVLALLMPRPAPPDADHEGVSR